LSAGKDIIKQ